MTRQFGCLFLPILSENSSAKCLQCYLLILHIRVDLPNYNANTIILIPKTNNSETIGSYRHIALANFKFKITKILAGRFASIMPSTISPEHGGFIKGRQIKDCICVTSEAINILDNKCFGGNLAFKIDISKAFETIDSSYLIKVLRSFGFNNKFCSWIEAILESAHLSISVNGKQYGYFNCKKGIRQGDPLSPLLFCIAGKVFSRGILNVVKKGNLELIKGTKYMHIPSHTLYDVDDIMVFCKGKSYCFNALETLFTRYALLYREVINPAKSIVYACSM